MWAFFDQIVESAPSNLQLILYGVLPVYVEKVEGNVCDGVRAASSFDSLRVLYAKAVLQFAKVGSAFLAENDNFSIYDRLFRFHSFGDGLNFWIEGCHVAEVSVLK